MDRKAFSRTFPHVAAGLSNADADALIAACRIRALVPGDVLIEEGSPSASAYFVAGGHLGVTISIGGERIVVGRVGPGSMVGEVSFVDHGPASATLTAQGPVTVFEMTAKALDGLVADHPGAVGAVQRATCEALATHLHDATNEMLALTPTGTLPAGIERDGLLAALRVLFGLGSG